MLSKVANNKKINHFFVFDHHKSALEGHFNKYPFTTIQICDENGLCCGTSLFYKYLVSHGFIDANNKSIYDFSELTRKYDTWKWKTKYMDEIPHELTLLFDSIGCDGYIKLMYQKLLQENMNGFSFNEMEKMLIKSKRNQVQEKLSHYAKNIYYENICGLKAGIVFIDYEYRNDLAKYCRQNNFNMDFIMLIALDYGTISYRSIKDNVKVRRIAEAMGGKGYDKAASSPIGEEQKKS